MNLKSAVFGTTFLVVLLTAGTAQSLSDSNTVHSDDIVDLGVKTVDLGTNSVTRSKVSDNAIASPEVLNNSLTGADINESTLTLPRSSGPVNGREIISNLAEDTSLGSGSSFLRAVTCPSGKVAVGASITSSSVGVHLLDYPTNSGWSFQATNNTDTAQDVHWAVVCVNGS